MSGVFPGTRTMVFQRVRVRPLEEGDETPGAAQWVRLLWYEEPAACAVELGANLLRIPQPLDGDLGARLAEALAANIAKQVTAVFSLERRRPRLQYRGCRRGRLRSGGHARSELRRACGAITVGAGLQPLGTGWERGGGTTDTGRTNAA